MYDEEILTIEEVMEFLCIGKNTVYALLNSGELKGFRIGRRWKVTRGSVNLFLIEQMKLQV